MLNFFRLFKQLIEVNEKSENNYLQKANKEELLYSDLSQTIRHIQQLFHEAPDLIIRRFQIKSTQSDAALVYFSEISDKNSVQHNVLHPLIHGTADFTSVMPVTVGKMEAIDNWKKAEQAILNGDSVLFINGQIIGYQLDTKGGPKIEVKDPQNEISLKGAHQSFGESDSLNIALIRRYIPQQELILKEKTVGSRGNTKVSILYLNDVASKEVLNELEARIEKIEVDAIINTGELLEFIEDNPFSPFPQFLLTERPDTAVSHILQGRFAVVVDRSPFVLIAPAGFISFFQAVDDYSTRWLVASFTRLLRMVAFVIALFLPATYVALISFNFEVIPMQLYLSIAESRTQVPFSPVMEAFLMELTLEMMREAAVRLPSPIGQTVGIVGGIIIGQAAVQAGIVSNIMIIVVAVTAIASFIIPNYDMGSSIRLLRFPMMLFAALFGIVGIVIGAMTLVAHFVSLESLGTPYGSPFAPFQFADMKDAFLRFPLWSMKSRPKGARAIQSIRQGENRKKG